LKFGTWNVKSLYRPGSLRAVARELGWYRIDLEGTGEVHTGVWWGSLRGRGNLEDKRRLEDNIKTGLKDVGWRALD
jgi:hypothetical protein